MVAVERCGCCGAAGAEPAGRAQGVEVVRCLRCRTLRFDRVAAPDAIYADDYHTGAHEFGWDYGDVLRSGYDAAQANDRLDLIERHHREKGTLVDVGGGLGGFVKVARDRGWDGELLEPVPAAVEQARNDLGVPGIVGGADDLPGLGRTWDVVTFLHSLEHLLDAAAALERTREVVAPDGLVFVEVPNYTSMARRMQGDEWLGWQAGQHVHLFQPATLRGLLERCGYEVVHLGTYVPGWHGMLSDGYAHMLGLQPALYASVRLAQRARQLLRPERSTPLAIDATDRSDAPSGTNVATAAGRVPISEEPRLRRWAFTTGFDALATLEEKIGVGTNLQAVARPRR